MRLGEVLVGDQTERNKLSSSSGSGVRNVWRREASREREAWWENIERVISLFSLDKSERWRVGWVWCFYSNHTSGIFFLSKKFIFLYGFLLFFFPFFLVSFLKILTTEFSDEEDVAVVVFCFWCIVLGAWFLNKGLSPYGCIYIERVLYQHRKIWLQMMRPINVFVSGFVFFLSIVIVNF